MNKKVLIWLSFLAGVYIFSTLSCTSFGLLDLLPVKENIEGQEFCGSKLVIADDYDIFCNEDEPPAMAVYSGTLTNVGTGYAHNVSVYLKFAGDVVEGNCAFFFGSIGPGETVPLMCSFNVDQCETSKLSVFFDKGEDGTCEYLTYPEHLDRIAAKDQGNEPANESETVLDQVFDKIPTWDCQLGPSMEDFWCADAIKDPLPGLPAAECVKEEFRFQLNLNETGVDIDYYYEVIENIPRLYNPSELGALVEYGMISEIQGSVDWQNLKFFGILPWQWTNWGGETDPELSSSTHNAHIFGEYFPEQMLVHVCINHEAIEGIDQFDESMVNLRYLCGMHFICTPIASP